MNFLVLAPNSWNGPWMNRQQLFSRIGKQHNVIYSNGLFYNWEMGYSDFKAAPWFASLNSEDNVQVYNTPKSLLRVPKLTLLDRLVNRIYIGSLLKKLGGKISCLYIFHPSFAEYVDLIPHDKLVYHAYDDFSKQGAYARELQEKEKYLISQADVLIASSRSIKSHLETYAANKTVNFVANGVNYEEFSVSKPEPVDLLGIEHPRVGYTGSINKKVDLPLLLALAEAMPEVNFVLSGGMGDIGEQKKVYEELLASHNVHFLGAKPVTEIAAYMQHMDINTMLYTTSGKVWASSGYPLKLHEYLAVGKPVISADIEAVREFSDVVSI